MAAAAASANITFTGNDAFTNGVVLPSLGPSLTQLHTLPAVAPDVFGLLAGERPTRLVLVMINISTIHLDRIPLQLLCGLSFFVGYGMPRPAGNPLQLTAKEHRGAAPNGGSGAQIYRVVENGDSYVVKLKGSAQGIRILFNEYVSGRLGEFIGVPFGDHALIEVSEALHPPDGTPNIVRRSPGTQFGTTFYEDGQREIEQLRHARNFTSHFPGVIVFDTFIARGDSRQYVVYPGLESQNGDRDTGVIFDQGNSLVGTPCVANDDLDLRPHLNGIANYVPFIERVENLTDEEIRSIVREAPLQQWEVTEDNASAVVDWLIQRRGHVRAAIEEFVR